MKDRLVDLALILIAVGIAYSVIVVIELFTPTPSKEVVGKISQNKGYQCLVDNAYHEARGESLVCIKAVTQVVMNRAKGDFNKVCDVVYKPWQFSWTHQTGKVSSRDFEAKASEAILEVVDGNNNVMKHATHYHANYVNPKWASRLKPLGACDNHLFYK